MRCHLSQGLGRQASGPVRHCSLNQGIVADSFCPEFKEKYVVLHSVRFVPICHTSVRLVWSPSQFLASHGPSAASACCMCCHLSVWLGRLGQMAPQPQGGGGGDANKTLLVLQQRVVHFIPVSVHFSL